jgi:hypothetical protein
MSLRRRTFSAALQPGRRDREPGVSVTCTSEADHVDSSIQVAGRYISFGVASETYLADTTTHRYIEISPGGWTRVDTTALVLVRPSPKKASHPISEIIFLPLESLPPIPDCH